MGTFEPSVNVVNLPDNEESSEREDNRPTTADKDLLGECNDDEGARVSCKVFPI